MAEQGRQRLLLTDRSRLELDGVKNVCGFDEEYIRLSTVRGEMLIKGSGLNIDALALEKGELVAGGLIDSIAYVEESAARGKGKKALKRLLK